MAKAGEGAQMFNMPGKAEVQQRRMLHSGDCAFALKQAEKRRAVGDIDVRDQNSSWNQSWQ